MPAGSQASAEAPATATKMLTVSARAECESKEPRTGCLTFIELAGTGETHQPALRETAPLRAVPHRAFGAGGSGRGRARRPQRPQAGVLPLPPGPFPRAQPSRPIRCTQLFEAIINQQQPDYDAHLLTQLSRPFLSGGGKALMIVHVPDHPSEADYHEALRALRLAAQAASCEVGQPAQADPPAKQRKHPSSRAPGGAGRAKRQRK